MSCDSAHHSVVRDLAQSPERRSAAAIDARRRGAGAAVLLKDLAVTF